MSKTTKKRVWIDPNSTALAYLKERAVSERESDESRTVARTPEVLPPVKRVPRPEQPQTPPGPPKLKFLVEPRPLDLDQFERDIRAMVRTLNFDIPEGFFDKWFYRPSHRIAVKAERAELIAEFQAKVVRILREKRNEMEEIGGINKAYIDQIIAMLIAWRKAAEAHFQVFLAKGRAENERRIEAAKTEAEIAKSEAEAAEYRKRIRDAEREPLPQSSQQEKAPIDQDTLLRDEARRDRKFEYDIAMDELADEADFRADKTKEGLAKIHRVFGDGGLRRGAQRARILELMEVYELSEDALSAGIRELIEEDTYEEEEIQ